MTHSVLILDGNTKTALSVTRSLGATGYTCLVSIEEGKVNLASTSKYCTASISLPSPMNLPNEYQECLIEAVEKLQPDFLLPLTDLSLEIVKQCRKKLPKKTNLPFSSNTSLNTASDKFKITEICKKFNIKSPATYKVDFEKVLLCDEKTLQKELPLHFPYILKPRFSIQESKDSLIKAPIHKIDSRKELIDFVEKIKNSGIEYIAQEYIWGEGVGVFLLVGQSTSVHFSHKRILEKPPEGGVSVVCKYESVPHSIIQSSKDLLASLKWKGVAMLEFKKAVGGDYFLIEINPRFWGSLQLAIDAGVNFPALLLAPHQTTPEGNIKKATLRWEFGIIDHMLILLKRGDFASILRLFTKNKLHLFDRSARFEIFRVKDFKPFLFAMKEYLLGR